MKRNINFIWKLIHVFTVCADNNIDIEGAKVLGEALKHNSTLTELRLESLKVLIIYTVMQVDSYSCYVCTGCNIGNKGANGLGEALKYNTTLTSLDLACIVTFLFIIF